MDSDTPIHRGDDDRFGYNILARQLAPNLILKPGQNSLERRFLDRLRAAGQDVLLARDGHFLFLVLAMLLEKLIEQHCVHLVVAHAVRFSFLVAHHQIR
jgi:hypothetical protein